MDLYALLALEPTATTDDIKRAYRRHAIRYHPDRNKTEGATAHFQQLTKAYETLSDPIQRQAYDAKRQAAAKVVPPKAPQWKKVSPEDLTRKAAPRQKAAQPPPPTRPAAAKAPDTSATAATKPASASFFRKPWLRRKQPSVTQTYEHRAQAEQQAEQAAQAEQKRQQQQAQQAAQAAAKAAAEQLEQERCQHCRHSGRLLIRRHIYSSQGLGFSSRSRVNKGNFCASCLSQLLWQANLRTLLSGWWAWPKGPYFTLKALWANLWRDPWRQREANALLTYQFLRKKLREGQSREALHLAYRAYRLSPDPAFQQQMLDLIGRQTRLTGFRLRLHVLVQRITQLLRTSLMLAGLLLTLAFSLYWSLGDSDSWFRFPTQIEAYQGENYVLTEQLSVHRTPNPTSPALKLLLKYDSVFSPNGNLDQGFLEIRLPDQRVGYVALAAIGQGSGSRAKLKGCDQKPLPVEPGQTLRHLAQGPNSLSLTNPYSSDLLVRLSRNGQVIYESLLAPYQQLLLTQVADGPYQVEIEQGRQYHLGCRMFMRPEAVHQLPTELEFKYRRLNGYPVPDHQELKLPKAW